MATALPAPQGSAIQESAVVARSVPLLAVTVGFCLVEAALWSPKFVQLWTGLIAAAWIIGHTVWSGRSAQELGLDVSGFRRSAWTIAAALLAAAVLVWTGWYFGWLHGLISPVSASTHVIAYAVWSFQQEFILQAFLFLNLLPVFGKRRAILFSGIAFSVAHLPNPVLMLATLVSGLCFTAVFARHRNVYPLAIAHAVLGLSVAVALPADLHRNMRVGLGYFSYHSVPSVHNAAPLSTEVSRADASRTERR
jgi:membrane protease YdiL (CAAX protease family)